jgi:hypothetical protein
MTIATKSGGLIVKDGRLAQNCRCCTSDACDAQRLRVTISGLPDCKPSAGPQFALNTISNVNDCSFGVFRQNILGVCRYSGRASPIRNGSGGFQTVTVNFDTSGFLPNTIQFNNLLNDPTWGVIALTFAPESGLLRSLPFSGKVVPVPFVSGAPAIPPQCASLDWSNVWLTIDTGDPSDKPIECGSLGNACRDGIDSLGVNTVPGRERLYLAWCDACDPDKLVVGDSNVFPEVPELNISLTVGDVQFTTFACGGLPLESDIYNQLSGTYALKFSTSLGGTSLYGWGGRFFKAGASKSAVCFVQGTCYNAVRDGLAQFRVWPLGGRTNNLSAFYEMCAAGQIAAYVEVSLFSKFTTVPDVPGNYVLPLVFRGSATCQQAMSCRGVPSFNLSGQASGQIYAVNVNCPNVSQIDAAGGCAVTLSC